MSPSTSGSTPRRTIGREAEEGSKRSSASMCVDPERPMFKQHSGREDEDVVERSQEASGENGMYVTTGSNVATANTNAHEHAIAKHTSIACTMNGKKGPPTG